VLATDMLQLIIQNIGTGLLLEKRNWLTNVAYFSLVNRILSCLRASGVTFVADGNGYFGAVVCRPGHNCGRCARCYEALASPSPSVQSSSIEEQPDRSVSPSEVSSTWSEHSPSKSSNSSYSSNNDSEYYSDDSSGNGPSGVTSVRPPPNVERNERTDIIASNIVERLEELVDLRERTEQLRLENSRLQQRAEALSELGERAIEVMSSLLPRMEELIQQRERTRELELENARLQQRLEEEEQRVRQLRLQNLELQLRQREESGETTRLVILVIRNSRLAPEPTGLLNQRERREV